MATVCVTLADSEREREKKVYKSGFCLYTSWTQTLEYAFMNDLKTQMEKHYDYLLHLERHK